MSHNILIGSGIASLGFLENIDKSQNFQVYDRNEYVGGHAYSFKIDDMYFDEGAHISHSNNKNFLKYIDAYNENKFRFFKSKVCNFYENRKLGYPIQLNLKDLKFNEKIKFLKESFTKTKKLEECKNYHEWLLNSYGKFLTENYYNLYTKKYWRTNPIDMSIDWTKGRLAEKKIINTIKSLFFNNKDNSLVYSNFRYPRKNGFFNIFKKKYDKFKINLDHNVEKIDLKKKKIYFTNNLVKEYNVIVSSIPLNEYKNIILNIPKNIYEFLNSLKYTKLVTYNYKLVKKINHDFHWCYFYDVDIPISRMSLLSNISPNYDKKHLVVQAEVFFRNDEKFNNEKYDIKVREEIIKFFNLDDEKDILMEKKVFIEKAYPIPLLGHQNKINYVKDWLAKNNIYQIGLYGNWEFMWTDQTFFNGKKVAEKINDYNKI
tara:strand:+ start:11051 stop:12340 length:1290 start_codon:yes stop_codon:yes gene_type:complete